MKFWTVAYQEKGSLNQYPIYEGLDDGRYYLGGSASKLYPLLFSTKKDAETCVVRVKMRVKMVEEDKSEARNWVENGKFVVTRCSIEI